MHPFKPSSHNRNCNPRRAGRGSWPIHPPEPEPPWNADDVEAFEHGALDFVEFALAGLGESPLGDEILGEFNRSIAAGSRDRESYLRAFFLLTQRLVAATGNARIYAKWQKQPTDPNAKCTCGGAARRN